MRFRFVKTKKNGDVLLCFKVWRSNPSTISNFLFVVMRRVQIFVSVKFGFLKKKKTNRSICLIFFVRIWIRIDMRVREICWFFPDLIRKILGKYFSAFFLFFVMRHYLIFIHYSFSRYIYNARFDGMQIYSR